MCESNPAIVYLHPHLINTVSEPCFFSPQMQFDWQFTTSELRGSGFTPNNYHSGMTLLLSVNVITRSEMLNGLNIPLTHPPEPSSVRHSFQWDFWVFYSLRVNPPQSQIDLITNGAKNDNLHIHGGTEKCWPSLTRVTLQKLRLISADQCRVLNIYDNGGPEEAS